MSGISRRLYLLAGQSNMAGRGDLEPQDKEIHPRVFTFDKSGRWLPAADPIHFDKPVAGVGPGLTFGKIMAGRYPAATIGLIPCAAGGSPMRVWRPGGYWEDTNSRPYDDAIGRTEKALEQGALKGILWHQGEADSDQDNAPHYQERLIELINRFRNDLNARDVPFIVATLGDFFVEINAHARIVNQALGRIPSLVPHSACVDSSGLAHKGDVLHFCGAAARELGKRYAGALLDLPVTRPPD